MDITKQDIQKYYASARAYQDMRHDEIADAIRYVDETTKANDPIVALDFAKRIRALKGKGGDWTGNCCFGDNVPTGCGEVHGLEHLDYKLVNCVTARMKNPEEVNGKGCLCEDNFYYGSSTCDGLHGLRALDYSLVNATWKSSVIWGYYAS